MVPPIRTSLARDISCSLQRLQVLRQRAQLRPLQTIVGLHRVFGFQVLSTGNPSGDIADPAGKRSSSNRASGADVREVWSHTALRNASDGVTAPGRDRQLRLTEGTAAAGRAAVRPRAQTCGRACLSTRSDVVAAAGGLHGLDHLHAASTRKNQGYPIFASESPSRPLGL